MNHESFRRHVPLNVTYLFIAFIILVPLKQPPSVVWAAY